VNTKKQKHVGACGPSQAPEGSAAQRRRRARASGGGAPRALTKEDVWQSDEDAEERVEPAGDA